MSEQILNLGVRNIIKNYREDLDLKNMVDWIQGDWVNEFQKIFSIISIFILFFIFFYNYNFYFINLYKIQFCFIIFIIIFILLISIKFNFVL